MANDSMTPSGNVRALASMVREEDLAELEALHSELVKRVDQARSDGRIYLMSQYVRLIALVSPEIDRVQRRFKRETLAALRKDHKAFKEQSRADTTA
jgi:DNA-binding GntR family transcriptional regulator